MFIYWAACLNEKSKHAVRTILCGTLPLSIQISVSFTYVSVRHRVSLNLRLTSGMPPIRIFALCAAKSASEPSDVSALNSFSYQLYLRWAKDHVSRSKSKIPLPGCMFLLFQKCIFLFIHQIFFLWISFVISKNTAPISMSGAAIFRHQAMSYLLPMSLRLRLPIWPRLNIQKSERWQDGWHYWRCLLSSPTLSTSIMCSPRNTTSPLQSTSISVLHQLKNVWAIFCHTRTHGVCSGLVSISNINSFSPCGGLLLFVQIWAFFTPCLSFRLLLLSNQRGYACNQNTMGNDGCFCSELLA
jgi:hypothetical protein